MKDYDFDKLKAALDEGHQWPCEYVFKFVVPNNEEKVEAVLSLLQGTEISQKKSKTGKYISFTGKAFVSDSQYIVDTYRKASKIEGLLSL